MKIKGHSPVGGMMGTKSNEISVTMFYDLSVRDKLKRDLSLDISNLSDRNIADFENTNRRYPDKEGVVESKCWVIYYPNASYNYGISYEVLQKAAGETGGVLAQNGEVLDFALNHDLKDFGLDGEVVVPVPWEGETKASLSITFGDNLRVIEALLPAIPCHFPSGSSSFAKFLVLAKD